MLKFSYFATILAVSSFVSFSCNNDDEDIDSNHNPEITIISPNNSDAFITGDLIFFSCNATDTEDGDLEGTSITWVSDNDGEIGTGLTLETGSLTVNQHTIQARCTDSDGLPASDSVTITVFDDQRPMVTITSPENADTIAYNETILLECLAMDNEDGELSDGAICWKSSIDGDLGYGTSLPGIHLTSNVHLITATATDSHGNTAQDSVFITVNQNQPPIIEISSPENFGSMLTGETITMVCNASDPEDGSINETSITWHSSNDGELGSGSSISTNSLSVNTHLITVTATDSEGLESTDSITFCVYVDDFMQMIGWLTGSFSSEEQAETSSDPYHYDVRRKSIRIWDEETNGYWMYLEQAYAESQNNPYFQRIYHFYVDNDSIKNTIYALDNPGQYVGAWSNPGQFDNLEVDDLTERDNCGVTFIRNLDHFYGTTTGTSCYSTIPGVAYMTSEQWIYSERSESWDLGWNDNGVIVMGPYSPYRFDKLEDFEL